MKEAAAVKVDAAFMSRIERVRILPSLETILRLAQALNKATMPKDKRTEFNQFT